MKKNIYPILLIAVLVASAAFFQLLSVSASYIPFVASNPCISGSPQPGQILYYTSSSTCPIAAITNSFATTSPYGNNEINVGAYANYPNPSGMFNTYDESAAGNPVLGSSFMGSTTAYVQIFGQNLNSSGSMDLVFADDKGSATSSSHYLDMGIANSKQMDTTFTALNPLYGYLFNQGSPLVIGTGVATSTIISQGMTSTSSSLTIDQYGRTISHGTAPSSLSGCGTSPSVVGNDANGVITLGAGLSVTACTMSFAHTWPTGSTVSCQGGTNSTLSPSAPVTALSNTSITFGLTVSLGSGKIYYSCQASQ